MLVERAENQTDTKHKLNSLFFAFKDAVTFTVAQRIFVGEIQSFQKESAPSRAKDFLNFQVCHANSPYKHKGARFESNFCESSFDDRQRIFSPTKIC